MNMMTPKSEILIQEKQAFKRLILYMEIETNKLKSKVDLADNREMMAESLNFMANYLEEVIGKADEIRDLILENNARLKAPQDRS
ncbi:hypothetical protein SAMN05421823_10661 [Catalinimonas alkaloidigena]|uniref:Uncharacterized protein n=2 Tax=Catalinimonas alkaloidigena TaxID=1075417 RepID=A0A1G9K6H8_9BACT|nr:hypothetical protein SAMN05421823_10661 [Catalinimonas alkaloidigena]